MALGVVKCTVIIFTRVFDFILITPLKVAGITAAMAKIVQILLLSFATDLPSIHVPKVNSIK